MDPVHLTNTAQYQSPAPLYSGAVAAYLHHSRADSTHRAYEGDLAHFRAWGGAIPTTSEPVAEYLAAHAQTLSMATLDRRMVSISQAHAERGFPSPRKADWSGRSAEGSSGSTGRPRGEPLRFPCPTWSQ